MADPSYIEMPDGQCVVILETVSLTCTCGGTVVVAGLENGMEFVSHDMPMCYHYEQLDPMAFMDYLRSSLKC